LFPKMWQNSHRNSESEDEFTKKPARKLEHSIKIFKNTDHP